jgi:hypothetical protein
MLLLLLLIPCVPPVVCVADDRVLSVSGSRSVCVGGDAAYFLCWQSTSVRHTIGSRYRFPREMANE